MIEKKEKEGKTERDSNKQDLITNHWRFINPSYDFLKCNWKLIVPLAVATCLFSATFFTKKDITFAVNIWVFPGFAVLIASMVCSDELQKWIRSRPQELGRRQSNSTFVAPPPPPPCAPPPPPTFFPPPPPPNTMIGRKRNRIDCRKLSWETLSPDLLKQETIWKRVKKCDRLEIIFDPEDIVREFSISPSQDESAKAKRENAMNDKKIFNISIVMSHYKLKAREVAQCLVSGTSDLTPDVLRQLLVFAPDDREARAIRKQARENESLLETAERFYLEIAKSVPTYRERLRTVLLKAQFEERVNQIKPHLETVITACQELVASEKLAIFIELLLTMGNIMNNSNVSAFKIAFVTKLMDYKSSVNKETSVLDYLTRVIIKKCPHIAALEEDLKHVKDASRVPLKTLDKEISELSSEIEVLKQDVEKINKECIIEDTFPTSIELFVVTADKKIEELLALRKTLDRKFYLLVRYFGEGSIKAEELFEIFTTLLRQFEDVLKTYK